MVTLACTGVPDIALIVTVAVWSALSLLTSVSEMLAFTTRFFRSVTTTNPDAVVAAVVLDVELLLLLEVLPLPTFCPTAPVTDVIVPSPGAVSTVAARLSLACWSASCVCRYAVSSAFVPVPFSRAAFRLPCAMSTCHWACVGSSFASCWPLVTESPTLTLTSVTVPLAPNDAAALNELCTVPEAVTTSLTSRFAAAAVRAAVADWALPEEPKNTR